MTDLQTLSNHFIEDELKQKRKNEAFAILLGLVCQLIWAFISLQLKTFPIIFPKDSDNFSIGFYRALPLITLGYSLASKKNIEITPISQVQNKLWFVIRNAGMFFCLALWVTMTQLMRLSTCQCISGCHPVLVLYLSILILKEKFYLRYLIGILLSLLGASLIVLNERKEPEESNQSPNGNVLLGIVIGCCHLTLFSLVAFSQKALCNENMSGEVQNFYLGVFNAGIGFVFMVLLNNYGLNILYVCYALINGLLFYAVNALTAECLKYIPISKFMPITYMGTVYVFFLSSLILKEPIYITDILGSGIIIGFQLFNIWVPI